ncbi:MAG: hypothetical protein ABIY51_13925 [Ferruginibacter sp.]
MKKIFIAAIAFSSILSFSNCNNSTSGDPKVVLGQFIEALGKKDIATARKLATEESKSMLDLMEMGMKAGEAKEMDKYDKSKMVFGNAVIDGDKATVPVKETTSGETVNYSLKKENGNWKVAFDKGSLMNIGMDKMKEKGMNPADSMGKVMDQLKNMDMDSLKRGMQEGMKALDTLDKLKKQIQ